MNWLVPFYIKIRKRLGWVKSDSFILAYHRIGETTNYHNQLSVQPKNFDAQLALLSKYFEPLDLNSISREPHASRMNSYAITFDDGYLDNLTTALPILEKYNTPATFFICPRPIEHCTYYWWDLLEVLFFHPALANKVQVKKEIAVKLSIELSINPVSAYENIADKVKTFDGAELRLFSEYLINVIPSSVDLSPYRLMDTKKLEYISTHPLITLGSHTLDHVSLRRMQTREILYQLKESKSSIEKLIGKKVDTIAYPYGSPSDYSSEVGAIAQQAGYDWGFTISDEVLQQPLNKMAIPRFYVIDLDADHLLNTILLSQAH